MLPPLSGADPGVTRVLPGCYPDCHGCYLGFLYIIQVLLRLSGDCLDNTGCMGVTCMLPDLPECIPGGSQVEHMMFPWVARILRFPHGFRAATRNLRNPAPQKQLSNDLFLAFVEQNGAQQNKMENG